ncbi:MAG: hypothetical protein ACTSUO_04080 [Candidatus Thorarchaeota archaeon]
MIQKCISLFIIAFLCVQIPVGTSYQHQYLIESEFTISDDSGPTFTLPLPMYCTCAWGEGFHEFAVDVDVVVTDADGVDTVIGSYCLRGNTQWTNISLERINPASTTYSFTFAELLFLPFDLDTNEIIFDMIFYANDTLGNWAQSDGLLYHYGIFSSSPNWSYVIISIIFGASVIVLFFIYRRKNTQYL